MVEFRAIQNSLKNKLRKVLFSADKGKLNIISLNSDTLIATTKANKMLKALNWTDSYFFVSDEVVTFN